MNRVLLPPPVPEMTRIDVQRGADAEGFHDALEDEDVQGSAAPALQPADRGL